jgi:hypothetical protein
MSPDGQRPGAAAAAAELAALQAGRVHLADRLEHSGSWWPWDVGLGLWVFLLLGAQSLRGVWWVSVAVVVLAVVGVRVVYVVFRRITGVWVNGFRRGRTRKVIGVWLAVYALVVAVGSWAEFALGWPGAMAVAGAVLGVAVAFINRWWMRVYAAELRGES